jgi:hypothetical protein
MRLPPARQVDQHAAFEPDPLARPGRKGHDRHDRENQPEGSRLALSPKLTLGVGPKTP